MRLVCCPVIVSVLHIVKLFSRCLESLIFLWVCLRKGTNPENIVLSAGRRGENHKSSNDWFSPRLIMIGCFGSNSCSFAGRNCLATFLTASPVSLRLCLGLQVCYFSPLKTIFLFPELGKSDSLRGVRLTQWYMTHFLPPSFPHICFNCLIRGRTLWFRPLSPVAGVVPQNPTAFGQR